MNRHAVGLAFFLFCTASVVQGSMRVSPYLQQHGIYFSSDHITAAGIGPGVGAVLCFRKHFIAQSDINIGWINGTIVTTRFSAGCRRAGTWAPALLCDFSLLWGSRTEVLLEDGSRPVTPVAVAGLRLAPLRFENGGGFVSALEAAWGFGPYKGSCFDMSLVTVGINLQKKQ